MLIKDFISKLDTIKKVKVNIEELNNLTYVTISKNMWKVTTSLNNNGYGTCVWCFDNEPTKICDCDFEELLKFFDNAN